MQDALNRLRAQLDSTHGPVVLTQEAARNLVQGNQGQPTAD